MQFPLSLSDISLWLVFTAIILLVTSGVILPYYRKTGVPINKRRLRAAAIMVGLLFIFTVFLHAREIIMA